MDLSPEECSGLFSFLYHSHVFLCILCLLNLQSKDKKKPTKDGKEKEKDKDKEKDGAHDKKKDKEKEAATTHANTPTADDKPKQQQQKQSSAPSSSSSADGQKLPEISSLQKRPSEIDQSTIAEEPEETNEDTLPGEGLIGSSSVANQQIAMKKSRIQEAEESAMAQILSQYTKDEVDTGMLICLFVCLFVCLLFLLSYVRHKAVYIIARPL